MIGLHFRLDIFPFHVFTGRASKIPDASRWRFRFCWQCTRTRIAKATLSLEFREKFGRDHRIPIHVRLEVLGSVCSAWIRQVKFTSVDVVHLNECWIFHGCLVPNEDRMNLVSHPFVKTASPVVSGHDMSCCLLDLLNRVVISTTNHR